jgi:hypothetical protein
MESFIRAIAQGLESGTNAQNIQAFHAINEWCSAQGFSEATTKAFKACIIEAMGAI